MNDPVLQLAAEGGLVLTANQRLMRELRRRYDDWRQQVGDQVWPSPAIQDVQGWLLGTVVERLLPDLNLLRPLQSQYLWERCIEADLPAGDEGLLQLPAAARQAAEAHSRLLTYGGDPEREPLLNDDQRAFLRWRTAYQAACRQRGVVDGAEASTLAVEMLARSEELPLPAQAVLVGFDTLTPLLTGLLDGLRRRGCSATLADPPTVAAVRAGRTTAADPEREVRLAACWARQQLQAGAGRIGILAADLRRYQPLVERIFAEELDPASLLQPGAVEEGFSLSLGRPLARQGVVAAALELLAMEPALSLDRVSRLLRCPYLGSAVSEGSARARFEVRLRRERAREFFLSRLHRLLSRPGNAPGSVSCPRFAGIIQWLDHELTDTAPASPGAWVRRFSRALMQCGWPGERPLQSDEYQAVKAWRDKVLPAVAGLDMIAAPLRRGQALALLRRVAEETPFQPEAPTGPIQVMGLLEAGGLSFDAVWVLGATDTAVPEPARPHPLLPLSLQRRLDMPHASADKEWRFAEQLVGRLLTCAPQVSFSCPQLLDDSPLRPSPLILHLPEQPAADWPSLAPTAVLRAQASPLERFDDPQGPPVTPGERVRGGTAMLKDQALCPFRAFAHHRLAIKGLEEAEIGLDAMTRGTLVHGVLQHFWQLTGDWEGLRELTAEALQQRVREAVEVALQETLPAAGRYPAPVLELERARLQRLVQEWLALEAQREPFAVTAVEQAQEVTVAGCAIRTRIDRIDRLEDGARVVIDYKTGAVDRDGLKPDSLYEPQLPLYATAADPPPAAAALAFVRGGECCLRGVADHSSRLAGVAGLDRAKAREDFGAEDWAELLDRWRQRLAQLGEAFAAGGAEVQPLDEKHACATCDLAALCRIGEIPRQPEASA